MKAVHITRHDMAEWIMAVGIIFGVALFVSAIYASDPWQDHSYDVAPPIVAGRAAPHTDGREKMVCSSCHVVVVPKAGTGQLGPLPIVEGVPAPHTDGREKVACTNCHTIVARTKGPPAPPPIASRRAVASLPHAVAVAMTTEPPLPAPVMLDGETRENFQQYRFQGKVARVATTSPQSNWGDVFILVDDGINPPGWIDLAPGWYMQSSGCQIGPGMFVKGTAYHDVTGQANIVYGRTITANGDLCTLRDNHIRGMWEIRPGEAEER